MRKLSVILLALAVTACGNTMTQSVIKPGEQSGGFLNMSTASEIDTDNGGALKGTKDVVIGGFKVGFTESSRNSNKAGGLLGGGFGGKSTALVKLEGVNQSTKQAIADAAYSDFVAKLKAKGFNVVDRSKLLANKSFAEAKTYPNPYKNDTSGMLSSYGGTEYYSPSSFGKQAQIFPGEMQDVMGGFAFANPALGAAEYANESGVKVLNVVYNLDFANTGGHAGYTSSSIEVGQGIAVEAGSFLGFNGGGGGTFDNRSGSIKLGQPIWSEKQFGKVVGETSDAAKGLEIATNVLGVLGGVGSNSTREYTIKANPGQYKSASLDVLKDANTAFAGTMGSLK